MFILIAILMLFITACTSKEKGVEKLPIELNNADKIQRKEHKEENENTNEIGDFEEEQIQDPLENLLERAPNEPTNLKELLNYPVGPLAGNGVFSSKNNKLDIYSLIEIVKETLPAIEEDVKEAYLDKWWRAFRYLFAEYYPNPNQIISKMKIDNFGNPKIEDERFQFKDQMNILVILDVSGSMANTIGGKSMMVIAKESIGKFISDLPDEANVGLRVYGHEEARTGKTKEQSCESTELVYAIQPLDKQKFKKIIDPFEPTGWTPIGLSLEKAKEDFADLPGEENTNLVYVVSDGAETCGGNPSAAAKELAESDIQPIINVIGFNVDIDGQSHLRDVAESGGGIYTNAGNEEQLQEVFNQAKEIIKYWTIWKNDNEINAYVQKSEQANDVVLLNISWMNLVIDEFSNLNKVIGHLYRDDYISRNAMQYFNSKGREQRDLYNDIREQANDDLNEKIENNYRELMKQINEEYNENTGE